MKKVASHPHFLRVSGLLVADALFFGLTNSQKVSSMLLAVGFILLVVTVYQASLALLLAANWYGLPGRGHRRRQARIATGVVGGLIALQSVGELGLRDVLVLLPLALVAYMYISYGKKAERSQVSASGQQPSLLSVD